MKMRDIMFFIRYGSLFQRSRHQRLALSRLRVAFSGSARIPLSPGPRRSLWTLLFVVALLIGAIEWTGSGKAPFADGGQTNAAGVIVKAGEKTLSERIEEYVFDRIGEFTAYNPVPAQTGPLPFLMASGKYVYEKAIACPAKYSFGTKIHIDGLGIYICEDRMAQRFRNKENFDILMFSVEEAKKFGRRLLRFRIIPEAAAVS
ncbi:MAG: 3D domain-containing protein [Nitrospirales bacterium]|nr:3D domain-containing protein [Nitrospirales bacterium]